MRILMGLILATLYLTTFYVSYRKNKDIFSPICFFSIIQFIAYIPGILYFKNHMRIELNNLNISYVFFYQLITLIFVIAGVLFYKSNTSKARHKYIVIETYTKKKKYTGIIIFIIGLASSLYFIYQSQGIAFIIANTQIDYASGNSYLLSLQLLMPIGILVLLDYYKGRKKYLVFFMFIIYSSVIFIFTRRAPIMEAFLLILFGINYKIKRIKTVSLLKFKTIFLILMFSVFLTLMPSLRSQKGFYDSEIFDIRNYKDILLSIENALEEFSFVSRDAFVYSNYGLDNMFFGTVIINIVLSPLPSSLFKWKPPVDDGVYLANFVVHNNYLSPPSTLLSYNSSYPFSSQGSMYANFGFIGVVLGSFFLGYLYEHMYRILKNTDYHIFMVIIYNIFIYKFAMSSKNIVQTTVMIVLVFLVFKIFCKVKIKKVYYGKYQKI